uniref:RagB/SusD family nutrient uptake outer membrane protein n=1 Tax=uncultured Draconibacterium sp. TaxID=1573823 RepID=UPI003217E142
MKKYISKIVVILFLLGLSGACDYLDVVPDNIATVENAFTDKYNAEKYLATCYSYLPNFGDPWVNPGLLSGDEVWFNEKVWDGKVTSTMIAKGFQNTTDPYLNFWDGGRRGNNLFIAIRDCNIFLEEISKVPGLSALEKKEWIAEVKFLKAFYHFWLYRSYGAIPIIKKNLPIDTSTDDVKVYRDPADDVVDYITETLDEAIPDLPLVLNSETSDFGRITQPIAKSIKALVLVTAASPLFNGNPDLTGLKDNRGQSLFNANYDASKWQKAADAALDAINTCELAGFALFDENTSRYEHSEAIELEMKLRSIITTKASPEVIWGATKTRFISDYQRMCQPLLVSVSSGNPVTQFYAPTLRMAELFYSKNGVPINEDPSFDYENRYKLRKATSGENDYVRSGEKTAILHFDREARFYADIAFDRGTYVLDPNYHYVQCRATELATKRNPEEYSVTGYFVKKLISPQNAFSGDYYVIDFEYPFPIIRLADLYLLYTEALNEVKDAPNAEVYEYIDRVRARAGLKGVIESWTQHSTSPEKPLTREGMRSIIQHERMIEMAFEGQRFWDLRRWKQAKEYMNKPIKGWNINGKGESFYNITTVYSPKFDFKDYLWPLKEEERIKNPNLVQNPGW